MNEKIPLQYDSVILCSDQNLPLVRRENSLYLTKTVGNTINVYPFTFTGDRKLITLTPKQQQEFQSIGVQFPSDKKAFVYIGRDQQPEQIEQIVLICGFDSIESSLCSLQAFYSWGMKIGDEINRFRRKDQLGEAKKLIDANSDKFTQWYRKLAFIFHPDALARKFHPNKPSSEQEELYTRLMQELIFAKDTIQSSWEGKFPEHCANIAATLSRIRQELEDFKKEEAKRDEQCTKDEEFYTAVGNIMAGLALTLEKKINTRSTKASNEKVEEKNQIKFLPLDELIERSGEPREEFIDRFIEKFGEICGQICEQMEKAIENHNKDKKVERLADAWEELKTETEAALAEPDSLSDSTINRLIRQLKGLIASLQQIVTQLEAKQQQQANNQEESTDYFASVASTFTDVASFFKGLSRFGFWQQPTESSDNNLVDDLSQESSEDDELKLIL